MNDALTQAKHSAGLTCKHLQETLTTADPVDALLLLPMIERIATVEREVSALIEARKARSLLSSS